MIARLAAPMLFLAVLPSALLAQGTWSPNYPWKCWVVPTNTPTPPTPHSIWNAALIPVGAYRGCVVLWVRYDEDLNNPPSATFVWMPSDPGTLLKVPSHLAPFGQDVEGAAITWDEEGQLIVVGASGSPGVPGNETWRFFPTGLLYPPSYGLPPLTCAAQIQGRAWNPYGLMSITRLGPTIIGLCRGKIFPDASQSGLDPIHSGSALVLGGYAGSGVPTASDGSEFLQALKPRTAPGTLDWSQTFIPPAFGNHGPPPPPIEFYALMPPASPLNQVHYDSAPCALQLGSVGTGTDQFVKSVFAAHDSDTVLASSPSGTSPSGVTRVIRPNYETSPTTNTQMWGATATNLNFDRTGGTAVLRHDLAAAFGSGYPDGQNRVISIGGVTYTVQQGVPGWYTNAIAGQPPCGSEYQVNTDPTAGTWRDYAGTGVVQGWMDNSAVILPTGEIFVVGGRGQPDVPIQIPLTTSPAYNDAGCLITPGVKGALSGWSAVAVPSRPPSSVLPPDPNCGCIPPRPFGHVSLLLADGTVFVAGGIDTGCVGQDERISGEVYRPDYVTYANRPSIISVDGGNSDLVFDSSGIKIDVMREAGDSIDRIVLIRPGAISRGFNSSQRYIELVTTAPGDYNGGIESTTFNTPSDDLAPPGHYMLFVVVSRPLGGGAVARIPSFAAWVRLKL